MNKHHQRGRGVPVLIILLCALAAGAGLWLAERFWAPQQVEAEDFHSLTLFPQPRVLADFRLQRADGSDFALADWQGQWDLVFFGFTYCPDICPMSLAMMRDLDDQLLAAGTVRPRVTFVSVDPERDDLQRLGNYVNWFSPEFQAVTGPHPQLLALTRQLGVIYVRQELEDGDYTIDHSGSIILIDPQGRLHGLLRPPHLASELAEDLRLALGAAEKQR